MPSALIPKPAPAHELPLTDPQSVVEAFLAALATKDLPTANALIDDGIEYINVGFPAVRGREEMSKVFDLLTKPVSGFEVYNHAISANGQTVLTERTDVLVYGRLRMQFWVCGRFDVLDGRITLWRDSFDMVDVGRALVRGVAAMVIPSLQTKPPRTKSVPPGR